MLVDDQVGYGKSTASLRQVGEPMVRPARDEVMGSIRGTSLPRRSASAIAGAARLIATIRRTDGSTQATYDRHPLYTYIGDGAQTAPLVRTAVTTST
jgi:hypothetical protein